MALAIAAASIVTAGTSTLTVRAAQSVADPELLIIDMDGNGICLSSPARGVVYKFNRPSEPPVRTGWTCAGAGDAFVVNDVTTNGRIDGSWEMLGGRPGPWPANGIGQLIFLDGWTPREQGRPKTPDGRIDAADWIYPQLALWVDQNHDGQSQEKELESAAFGGVISISLNAKVTSQIDASGNTITRRTTASIKRGASTLERQVVTVRFSRSPG